MRIRLRYLFDFLRVETGAVFAEAIIVLPVITIFSVGILEFGNILWQRHQVQTGVRDAARYWSRCPENYTVCSETVAQNIAFYGTPNPAADSPSRVPGWGQTPAADLVITGPDEDSDIITVVGRADYRASPLFNVLGLEAPIEIEYYFQTRYFGW